MQSREEDLKRLIELGILIPFDNNLMLYHGRARVLDNEGDKEWKVDQFFDNSANKTGNNNMSCLSVLYTCALKQAKKYSRARASLLSVKNGVTEQGEHYYQPETYRILPYFEGKYFMNGDFDLSLLNQEDKKIVKRVLLLPKNGSVEASAMSKPEFFEKENYHIYYNKMISYYGVGRNSYITFENVYDFCRRTGCDAKLANQLAGIVNAQKCINNDFIKTLLCIFVPQTQRFGDNYKNIPLDKEYILSWAKKNNIIGFSQKIISRVIEDCTNSYTIFNKSEVGTEKQIWEREINKNKQNRFARMLGKLTNDVDFERGLIDATPQQAVESLMNLNVNYKGYSYKKLFNLSANVEPERFTVAEHTETVLRVFEDSFKNVYSDEIIPFVKLVILCHDIGKGFTEYPFDPRQKEYNAMVANDFLGNMGVNDAVKKLILFIIGESQQYTHRYIVNRNREGKEELYYRCGKVLKGLSFDCDTELVNVLCNICLMLQSCDGGAYTIYAVTRDTQTNPNAQYKNYNERFSQSYLHSETGAIIPKMIYEDEENE